jgi:hypothetical protein
MSQESVERFLGRVITDERFRDRAKNSLEQLCVSEGYTLSKSETEYLENIDIRVFSIVALTLDDAIKRH